MTMQDAKIVSGPNKRRVLDAQIMTPNQFRQAFLEAAAGTAVDGSGGVIGVPGL